MAHATYAQYSFLGGEFSQFAQGRFDRPDYRIGMNVCLNGFPVEIGAWTRRPGTRMAGATKGGANARVAKIDFHQAQPIGLEFTDNWLRFRSGYTIVTTNDSQVVAAVSGANPAVVQTTTAHGWTTGNTVMFSNLGTTGALLQARQFTITVVDPTHLSLADALSGATIDGSTIGALSVSATVSRVHELTTPYAGGAWASVRIVQAETTAIMLQADHEPQALTVTTEPTGTANAAFSLADATFLDGPYLDPFTNGAQVTPGAASGIISLQVSFPTYSASTAYAKGAFVTATAVNYVSLVDQNVGNTPATNPTKWQATSSGAAINNGQGFLGTDIGRSVRLFSEPQAWNVSAGYAAGDVVSYNPSAVPGAATYWTSLVGSNTGNIPGHDTTHWTLTPSGAALWTWGRITSLSNIISPSLAGSANFGSMISGGGNSAAFDGVPSKVAAASADETKTGGAFAAGTGIFLTSYVGKNYSGASAQKITQAVVFPSSDQGIAFGTSTNTPIAGFSYFSNIVITLNLRAKHTAPASSSDGTILGTLTLPTSNTGQPQTIISNDQATAWEYVWIELAVTATITNNCSSYTMYNTISQVTFYTPVASGGNATANVEILGPALLYTTAITTWRLGAYSDTTGWPTCGTYQEGRLWLGGAIANRFDASVSNGINGSTVNFAPTDQYGVVTAASAISYTLNSNSVNPMFWMEPDLQGVLIGTQAGEFLVQAPTAGPITATNIAARRVTRIGCENIEPRRTEHTLIFVQRFGRRLREYFADVFSGKLQGPNLADKAQHITRAGILELAYQSAVVPIIWGRDALGALFGITYERDTLMSSQPPKFNAWHRHTLGSGRLVDSIAVGPSVGGDLDTLTMVTHSAATQQRWVEVLTDAMDEDTALEDGWFLDGAVAPTSYTLSDTPAVNAPYGGMTMNGLWHLNGATVNVFAGGLDCGTVTVANGSAFLAYGDGAGNGTGGGLFTKAFVNSFTSGIQVIVGYSYTSQGQLLRPVTPQETGARLGPAFGLLRRNHRYAFLVANVVKISIGTSFADLLPGTTEQPDGTDYTPLQMYSGFIQDPLDDDETYDGMLCWQITGPLPGTVIAVSGNIKTKDQ